MKNRSEPKTGRARFQHDCKLCGEPYYPRREDQGSCDVCATRMAFRKRTPPDGRIMKKNLDGHIDY